MPVDEQIPEQHPNWGGKRKNAGRPAIYGEPVVRTSISVPQEVLDWLRDVGNGNQSEGVRRLYLKLSDRKL